MIKKTVLVLLVAVVLVAVPMSGFAAGNRWEGNRFFFPEGETEYTYDCYYNASSADFSGNLSCDVTCVVSDLGGFGNGHLYRMNFFGVPEIVALEGNYREDLAERIYFDYFYVVKDAIYRFEPTAENLKILKEGEAIPPEKDEKGWHEYISAEGDTRMLHSYNDKVSTGFYERFVWQDGVGLIKYFSGYGAGRGHMELTLYRDGELAQERSR